MSYRKRTLRGFPPTTRKLARLIGEMESVTRRAKNLLEAIQLQERESQALHHLNADSEESAAENAESIYCGECGMSHAEPECHPIAQMEAE